MKLLGQIASAALLALLLSACEYAPSESGWPWAIATEAEPTYEVVEPSPTPRKIEMAPIVPPEAILEKVRSKYPRKIRTDLTKLSIHSEELVRSRGSYFRRVSLFFTVNNTDSMHGHCGQWVLVWFAQSGKLAGIYAGDPVCPV